MHFQLYNLKDITLPVIHLNKTSLKRCCICFYSVLHTWGPRSFN